MSIPITIRCECGEVHSARLGDPVDCGCGRHYDTSTLPPEQFADARARQLKVKLYIQLGVIFVAGVSVATAALWGLRGIAIGLPLSGLVWFLFLGKWYRRRWINSLPEATTVKLEARDP